LVKITGFVSVQLLAVSIQLFNRISEILMLFLFISYYLLAHNVKNLTMPVRANS